MSQNGFLKVLISFEYVTSFLNTSWGFIVDPYIIFFVCYFKDVGKNNGCQTAKVFCKPVVMCEASIRLSVVCVSHINGA